MAADRSPERRTGGPHISAPLARNIEALMRRRRRASEDGNIADRVAARMAAFTGSTWSLLVHTAVFGIWILVNTGVVPVVPAWDPSLVVLAMAASVEAIFLTSFVLMNQNRLARFDEDRDELTLQISLLAEHEMTKVAQLVAAIADKVGAATLAPDETEELTQEVAPERVLDEIDRQRAT